MPHIFLVIMAKRKLNWDSLISKRDSVQGEDGLSKPSSVRETVPEEQCHYDKTSEQVS